MILKLIDLFCGIGGFRLALPNLHCVFSSDIDKHSRQSYFENFGEMPSGDIQEINECDIPEHDVLCGGFPCQPFSLAGERKSLADKRGNLFYDIIRIAKHRKPKVLLLENVSGLLNIDGGRVIQLIKREIENAGYIVNYDLMNSSYYGIPQARKRVYFVCIHKDSNLKYLGAPTPTYEQIFLKDVIVPNENTKRTIKWKNKKIVSNGSLFTMLKPIRLGTFGKGAQGQVFYSTNGHAVSQTGGGMGSRTGLYLADGRIRELSLLEGKRVMGFPDDHVISDRRQGYKQLGNAVIPRMIEQVWGQIQ